MNKIGFQNFRRFQKLEPLEYSGITFMVGRNNAGKSTLVKALLLIDNYFKSGNIDILSFGNNVLEDANIVTYGRAKNSQASENFISFSHSIENYDIELTVSGEEDKAFAYVHSLLITDIDNKLNFFFNIQNKFIRVTKAINQQIGKAAQNFIEDIETQIISIKKQIEEPELKKTSREYIELVSKLESLHEKIALAYKDVKDPNQDTLLFSLDNDFDNFNSLTEIVDAFLFHSFSQYEKDFLKVQNGEEPSEKFNDLRALKELDPIFIESSFSHFITLMNDFSMVYMGANPAKQSALFAIRDKNNALAQAIHEFKQLNITEGEEHRFVLNWMKEFEIGDDFSISMHAGEAYELKINSNNTEIHLADKGMGSIQAMLLIIRIACVIKKIKIAEKNSNIPQLVNNKTININSNNFRLIDKTTVIIEEPELNLHPALQSKLADLFLDAHLRFKINFLIETHSEYLVRRSQVFVAINEYEIAPNENPFCVYYFPKDLNHQPYRLDYQEDGTFKNNFEKGFFDEASGSTLELIKLKRQKSL
jgi:predicted ATPase